MQGIFQKENTDKALKYGIYRHLPTYEKIIRNLVSFCCKNILKGLKKKRHSISDLVDKTKTEIYNLTIEKNALEKETDDLKSRYNI